MPLVAGWLSDRIGRKPLIVGVYLGGAIGFAVFLVSGSSVVGLWAGIVLMGPFSLAESPQLQALLADIARPAIRDATFALYFTLAFGVGSLWVAIYGAIIGAAGNATGLPFVFVLMAATFVLAADGTVPMRAEQRAHENAQRTRRHSGGGRALSCSPGDGDTPALPPANSPWSLGWPANPGGMRRTLASDLNGSYSRVAGLGRGRGATDVPDEYTDLTRYGPGTRLDPPNSPEPGDARWRSFGRAPSAGPRTRAACGRRWTRPRLPREASSSRGPARVAPGRSSSSPSAASTTRWPPVRAAGRSHLRRPIRVRRAGPSARPITEETGLPDRR
jgi:hypothetical protein